MTNTPLPEQEFENKIDRLKGNQLTREQNIELVRKLLIRGVTSYYEIDSYLQRQNPPIKVTYRTISRYKNIIKKRNAKKVLHEEGLGKTIQEIAIELRDTFREVTKELWAVYHSKTASAQAKVSALAQITKISSEQFDRFQSLGLIHKEPDKHQVLDANGNPTNPGPVLNTNIETLNMEFTSFIKAKFQDPVGSNQSHVPISREAPVVPMPRIKPVDTHVPTLTKLN